MTGKPFAEAMVLSPGVRRALGAICILLVLSLLTGAVLLPFLFESQSIRYKLGIDKTLLRTGKIFGLTAATLLFLQLCLSARFPLLDRVFSLNRLYLFHRINAATIAVLAVLHPLFVFAPEDISSIPVELQYWPEVVGAFLLLLICMLTATGIWRLFLNFPFHRWWLFHRVTALTVILLLVVHVLNVSETFESGLPRLMVLLYIALYALIFCWVKIRPALLAMKPYSITNITKAAESAYSVEMEPLKGSVFQYIPGQFAFISFRSRTLSAEEHPFTISSTPTRPERLHFSIRCSGDWTEQAGRIRRGDTAIVDGPYGRFSHLLRNAGQELIMIAGGIGVTPMLSMLRYMVDTDDTRKVTLIWSNRRARDILFADEFRELEGRLKGLHVVHVLTRQCDGPFSGKRLDRGILENVLSGVSRKTPVFLCGPPTMMKEVRRNLIRIGFSRSIIYTEDFSL